MSGLLRRLALATGMLTVVRVPVGGEASAEELRASTVFYPLVGLVVGLPPALALLLPLPPLPRAALALSAWVVVTGALHLDGWADCCDAAFAPARPDAADPRARRLQILKDPRAGTFGVVGLVLLLLGKWSALAQGMVLAPLLAAPAGRWSMVLALRLFPPARSDGLGAVLAGRVPLGGATAALLLSVLAVVPLLPPQIGWSGGWAVLAGLGTGAATSALLAHRFGGVTGDVCGAAGEATELAVLLALATGAGP